MPKTPKKDQEIDVSRFEPLVEEALRAFSEDVSYAVEMSKQAVTVERKRAVWKVRSTVKKAESKAREQCSEQDFTCEVGNPCGTGECRFASEEFSQIRVVESGTTIRPKNSRQGPYSLEPVIKCLLKDTLRVSYESSEEE